MSEPISQTFCRFVEYLPPAESLDCPAMDAYNSGSEMARHMDKALQCALHVDHYQAVYYDLQGTFDPNPFNALRAAIDAAEKVAVSSQ